MPDLTIQSVAETLATHLAQVAAHQVTEPGRPDSGAVIQPSWGIDDPSGTAALLASCGVLRLAINAGARLSEVDDAWLVERAELAASYLLRAQRPTGRIDLRVSNYDSAPDTAFTMQWLCPVAELLGQADCNGARWAGVRESMLLYLRRAADGLLDGGFHTPNHRWVMAAAVVKAKRLFPDYACEDVLAAYLSEGFDISPDGFYTERSAGTYDAVCDLSLLALADYGIAGAREAVRANLDTNLHLLHADGTVDASLSVRQDQGTRAVPVTLAAAYLLCGIADGNAGFVGAARWLWQMAHSRAMERGTGPDGQLLRGKAGAWLTASRWLMLALLRHGEPAGEFVPPPESYTRHFAHAGLWRASRGAWSASAYRGGTRLFSFAHGAAELASVKISQTYFGEGRFVAEDLTAEGEMATIRYSGSRRPHRPGYDHPLGRPVQPEQWLDVWLERDWRAIPPCAGEVTMTVVEDGLMVRYHTTDGLGRVPAQVALDFPAGGIWETGDTRVECHAGQVLFLKRGLGTMWYGTEGIEIGPGAIAHTMCPMHDTEEAPEHVRILLTFLTPVDHALTVRARLLAR